MTEEHKDAGEALNPHCNGDGIDPKHAGRLLVDRERYLQTILETTADGFWVVDTTGRIVEVNDAYGRLSGYTRGELLNMNIADLEADESADEVKRHLQHIIEKRSEIFERRHRRKGGTVFDIEMSVAYLDLAGGQFICFCRDISERKRDQTALRESEKRLKEAHEIARMGRWELDLPTGRLLWSDGIYDLFEVRRDTFQPSYDAFLSFIYPEDRDLVHQSFRKSIERKMPYEIEHRLSMNDGRIKCVNEIGRTEYDDRGTPIRSIGTVQDITGRKQAEEALRRVEAKAAKMVANIGDVIVIIDGDGINRYKSSNIEKYFGWRPEEVVGASTWENVHPEDVAGALEFFGALIKEPNATGTVKCRYRCKDGRYKWIEFTGVNLLHDPDIQGVLGNYKDISERIRAEEQLRESHDLLSNLAGLVPGVIYQYRLYPDGHSDFPYSSPGMSDIYEVAPEQVRQDATPVFGRLHPDDHDRVAAGIFESARTLKTFYSEFRVVLPRQGVRWRWSQAHPVRMPDGGTLWHGIILDITERKEAEEKLKHSHELMRYVIEHSSSGVAVLDKALKYIFVSKRFLEEYRVTETEVIGRCHYDVFPEIPPAWREVHRKALAGEVLRAEEDPFEREDGNIDWTRWECRPWYEADGSIGGIILYTEVITERKKLEAKLLQAQKMESVGRLAGGVAHDYNNMLSVILGYTEMALEKVPSQDSLHNDLTEVFKAATRSADITRQLLAFARKQAIAPKVVDLNGIVASMLKMLRRLIGEDVDLVWRPGQPVWPIKIDPVQVDQILANLCVNARDAIEGVGRVVIETGNTAIDEAYCRTHDGFIPGEFVWMAVSDDGCGMGKETLKHIFEPFFTTKGVAEGTGLGLATVYGIVKQNDGFINVYSEPDRGTTFRIYLPRYGVKEKPMPSEGKAPAPKSRGETVLLAEDEPAIMRMTQMMLNRLGYCVLSADTPSQAIEIARKHDGEIALLISDVVMPEMDGRELAQKLNALYPGIKTLFMSGYTANIIAHRGVLEADTHFIQKPFSANDLGIKIRTVLDQK